ncbi:MAG: RNA polymerase sigma-70 factor [Dysgonamonadaceae bacterium]|jgi:RNA polymerase sigma-70 factor (ECF subfamily)|nr:RNA polymerase sigma-70 factor [Dysgonamonadaceae bacterium]
MKQIEDKTELQLLQELNDGSEKAFTQIFHRYYKDLVLFGGNIIREKSMVEDVVQSIFLTLWNNRFDLAIETSLKSYLLKSTYNGCLLALKNPHVSRTVGIDNDDYANLMLDYDTENYILFSELDASIDKALKKIPENYRAVFLLGKVTGLSYREISRQLSISERTVELRMSKALALMRVHLKDFALLLVILT